MNVKLIFVFSICVMLSNGLSSNNTDEYEPDVDEREEYRRIMVERWTPRKNGTFEEDDEGNIYIRIYVKPSGTKTELFMLPDMNRLGINVTSKSAVELKANLKVMSYFDCLLRAPYYAIELDDLGWTNKLKTIIVKRGYRDMSEVLKMIIDKYVELKFGEESGSQFSD